MSPCHHLELGAGDYRRDKDSIPNEPGIIVDFLY
jgi:hypothetical protein